MAAGADRGRTRLWRWARPLGTAATLGVLVWRLGASPFLDGIRTVDAGALAAAALMIAMATVCSAWRWKLVAGALGVDLPFAAALAAYYRALFLNVTLPGGVAGDVHRGISHGREVSDVPRALRAVAWERFAGQAVQVALTVAVLLVLPSPVRSWMPLVAAGLAIATCAALLLARARPRRERSAWARARRAVAGDVRDLVRARRVWPAVALASALAVCGYAATFLLAARTAGVTAPASQVLPAGLLVVLTMVVPSVAGWGPREGGAAWVFAAGGLGASRGVTAAVVYGVMVLAASLPGAAVLVISWARRMPTPEPAELRLAEKPTHA